MGKNDYNGNNTNFQGLRQQQVRRPAPPKVLDREIILFATYHLLVELCNNEKITGEQLEDIQNYVRQNDWDSLVMHVKAYMPRYSNFVPAMAEKYKYRKPTDTEFELLRYRLLEME